MEQRRDFIIIILAVVDTAVAVIYRKNQGFGDYKKNYERIFLILNCTY